MWPPGCSASPTSGPQQLDNLPCLWFNGTHGVGDCAGHDEEEEQLVPTSSSAMNVTEIYQTWTPVLIFFCALTFFVNVFIVVAAKWMRRPLTPTMYFSLSLAAADAVASLTVGLGLVLNR